MPNTGTISQLNPSEVQNLLLSGAIQLIDVRTPLEFESEHIESSKNIPLDELDKRAGEVRSNCQTVVICRSGTRAQRAAQLLVKNGLDIAVLKGGVVDWKNAGLKLKEGKKRLSLERQVQLTIGLILLTSTAAGWTINKGWFIVPSFIGAGLTFAGLSGNCGLAMLLAKAPWNKLDKDKLDKDKLDKDKLDKDKPTASKCCM